MSEKYKSETNSQVTSAEAKTDCSFFDRWGFRGILIVAVLFLGFAACWVPPKKTSTPKPAPETLRPPVPEAAEAPAE